MREDWVECKFEDLLNYEQPTKYIVKSTDYNDSYDIPVLTAGKSFIKGYTNEQDGIFDNIPTIIFDDFTTASQFVNFKFKVKSSAMKILVPTSNLVDMAFVFYGMQVNKIRSDTHKRYWISVFSKIPFLLPCLPEQRAIVAKIEELFSSLDKGIADLKKAQEQLKAYRQAVLKKAFEGELTKEWREKNNLNLNWKTKSFGEITINFDGKRKPLSKSFRKTFNGPYPYYGACEHIDDVKDYIFDGTYILIGEDGANLLSKSKPLSFIVSGKFWVNNHAHVVQPRKNIDEKFLSHQFNSLQINEFVTGTAQPKLNQRNLNKIPIKVPLIQEQHQIVQEIESRLSVCDAVEKNIEGSLEKAKSLRQSILKKAFEGTLLTEEEIAECKSAPDYEPASLLLEKINKEKTIKVKLKKIRKINKRPKKTPQISTDLQAGVIAKIIKYHESNPEHIKKLSHVKCEKISHLVEYHLQIPLGRKPVKDAAGPDDFNHLKKVQHRAKMTGYFSTIKTDKGETYKSGNNLEKAIEKLETKIGAEKKDQLDSLIKLFLPLSFVQSEIVATLYAGWNNLLIEGKNPTDEDIVLESRKNWSKRKMTLDRNLFFKTLNWMRNSKRGLIPTGYGFKVEKTINKKT